MSQSRTNKADNRQTYSLRPRRTKLATASDNNSNNEAVKVALESVSSPVRKRAQKTSRVVVTTPNKRARKKTATSSSKTETTTTTTTKLKKSQSTGRLKQKAVESTLHSQDEMVESLPSTQRRKAAIKKRGKACLDDADADADSNNNTDTSSSRASNKAGLSQVLLKDLVMGLSGARPDPEALEEIRSVSEQYFEQVANDLKALAQHANRSTIDTADIQLLFKRQNMLKDQVGMEMLSQQYLPRELLRKVYPAPCACRTPSNTIDFMEELDDTNDSITL
ncbi:hypothetical protein BDF22DRAFT_676107 [Syncephalis plumigaleata]|nr:hypothetical protein BDF22DRAFT_676107 [Syncephalis plumigaleata]